MASIKFDIGTVGAGSPLSPEQRVINVDPMALRRAFVATDSEFAKLSEGKLDRLREYIATGKPVSLSEIGVSHSRLGFTNGRHRAALAHALGMRSMPVAVDRSNVGEVLELLSRYQMQMGFEEFAEFLATSVNLTPAILLEGAAKVGAFQREFIVKEMIGHELSFWKPLAEATVEDKMKHGYAGHVSATDPLLRTGELRDSIEPIVISTNSGASVIVGSSDPVAIYQELGTSTIPPRPIFSISAAEAIKVAEKIFGNLGAELLTPVIRR